MMRRGSRVVSTQAQRVTHAKRMGMWAEAQRDDNLEGQLRASIAREKDKAMIEAAIARVEPQALAPVVPESKYELLRETYAKNATEQEFELFVAVANRLRLDPFSRQIYAIKRWDSQLRREVMQPQVSIDGMRLTAERSGKYAGQSAPEWCGADGVWKDVWLVDKPPVAARVAVYRSDFTQPIVAVALYREYVQTNKEGTATKFWRDMPANQLCKCAESLALRKAFPNELAGVYTVDEMAQAESPDERPRMQAHTTSTGGTAAPKPAPPPAPAKPPPPPAAAKQQAQAQAQAQAEMQQQVEAPRFSIAFPIKAWADKPMRAAPIETLADYIAWCEGILADQRRKQLHRKCAASKALAEAIYQEAAAFEMHRVVDAEENTAPIQPSDLQADHIATGLQAEYDRMHSNDGWGLNR